MKTTEDFFSRSKQSVKEYIEDRLLLTKLQLVNYVSRAAASAVIIAITSILSMVFMILLAITGGLYFAKLTGDVASGFAIMTGVILLLILLIAFGLKKIIQATVIHSLIQNIFKKEKATLNNKSHENILN